MNIFEYFKEIKSKTDILDSIINNIYSDLNNPFVYSVPKTYVWTEDD